MKTDHAPGIGSILFIILCLPILSATWGCDENPGQIGLNILSDTGNISVVYDSTQKVAVSTFLGDSVRASSKSLQLLGSYTDPLFGFSKAGIITQIEPPGTAPAYEAGDAIDSGRLDLYFGGHFGNDEAVHQVTLYEFTGEIDPDSLYFSSFDPEDKYLQAPIGTGMVSTADSVVRIRITDQGFLERIMEAEDTVYSDYQMLQEYFRGFYIKTADQETGGSILYTDLSDDLTSFRIFYRTDEDTLAFIFGLGRTTGMAINVFSHDYTGFPIEDYLENGSENDSLIFIQGMGGVKSVLRFPGLKAWKDSILQIGKVAVNNAELVLVPVNDARSSVDRDQYPPGLNLYWIDPNDDYAFVYDYLLDQATFGGDYSSDEDEYRFNLKTQIQSYIRGDIDEDVRFVLSAGNTSNALNFLILKGGSFSAYPRIRLELTYTIL